MIGDGLRVVPPAKLEIWAGGDDLGRFFTVVIPEATKIILPVVQKYGYEPSQEGKFICFDVVCLFSKAFLSKDTYMWN